ncbi:hypothetical protein [Fodinicurvata halophila]|uniref:hypothetical protein n=1 Tax=Fodinicurvata halophila TaxID=1419723 RepID=UPI003637FE60
MKPGTCGRPHLPRFHDGCPGGRAADPFRIPEDIRLVRVVHETGEAAQGQQNGVIWEAFQEGTGPEDRRRITSDGRSVSQDADSGSGGSGNSSSGGSTGGLY